jgi:tetratricopeptide (TPR) repeat protein
MGLMSPPRAQQALALNRRKHLVFIIVAVVFTTASPAAVWMYVQIADRREAQTVRHALEQGRLDVASRVLEHWLGNRPQAAEAHYLKARLAWARNDLPTVQQGLARARALGYPVGQLVELRGLLLARTNQKAEAEPLLRRAAETARQIDPDVAEALVRIYLGEFRLGRAAEILNRWMRERPDDARPYFLQTEIDFRNRASADVIIAHYRAALDRDPNLHLARLRLADSLRLNYHNDEAATEYTSYLKHNPDDSLAHLGAGQNALEMGDLAGAIGHLDRALVLAPHDPVVLGARASAEIRQSHLDVAMEYLDRAVNADPFDYGNRYQRMLILSRQGKTEQANAERRALDRIRKDEIEFAEVSRQLERDPLNLQLRSRAAQWLMDHGHEAEAIEWAKLVLHSAPSDPAMNHLLAVYYRKQGNVGLANFHEAHSTHTLDRNPSSP